MEQKTNYFSKGNHQIPRHHEILKKCYLCGSESNLDREHVIPKIIFRPSEATHPIILRSCRKCNNQLKGTNEEYIIRAIQITSFSKEAQRGFSKAIDGFKNGHGLGIMGDLTKRMQKGELKTQEGVLLGVADLLKIDPLRMNTLIINIAKGLLTAHSLKIYNWSEYNIHLGFDQAVQNTFLIDDPVFKDVLKKSRFSQYWRHIFFYCGDFIEKEDISIWNMIFYNSHMASVSFLNKKFEISNRK